MRYLVMKKIKLYSFFSGCGLLDLGMEEAGFDIAMVSEKYEPFLEAYKYSRKKMKIKEPEYGYFNDDICDYLEENSKLDILIEKDKRDSIIGFIGGPPCPDFSTAGKNKGINGDNGKLSKTYFDLICKEKPDFFVFENVKGLWRTKKHKEFYDNMYNKMKKQGYYLLDKLLNSLEYGVPQERERVIMIGIRVGSQKNKDQLKDIVKNFNWGIREYNILETIRNIDWPDTEPFRENSITQPPQDIIKELTIQHGQQRINAIFEYIAGKYKLQKKYLIDEDVKKKYADRYFYELDDDTKKAIWSYEMSIVNLDKHFSKNEVRNMFYRLNLTDYSLNEQEKRKSWDSEFGKVSEQLANEIFWQDYKIFSTGDIRRMKDVEYCSSILLLAREGIIDQTKGDRLDQIYRELGEEYVDSKEDMEKVHNAMELIKIITEDKTNGFVNKKIQMYTLFCVMFDFSEKKISISQGMVEKLKVFIYCYTLFKNEYEIDVESIEEQRAIEYLKKYKLASSEGVNKIGNRMIRFEVLKKVLLQTDGIETDIFEKIAKKMEELNSSEEGDE